MKGVIREPNLGKKRVERHRKDWAEEKSNWGTGVIKLDHLDKDL